MQYPSKFDWWVFLSMLVGLGLSATLFFPGFLSRWGYLIPPGALLFFFGFLFPVMYETESDALVLHAGMFRRSRIPYTDITRIGPSQTNARSVYALGKDRLEIEYQGKKAYVSPGDQDGFLVDVAMRSPQLAQEGNEFRSSSDD